jgi:hypothetical protein
MNAFFHHDVYGGGLGLGLGLDLDHLGILADLLEAQSVNVWAGQEELSTAVQKAVDIVEAEDMVSVLEDMVVFVVVVAVWDYMRAGVVQMTVAVAVGMDKNMPAAAAVVVAAALRQYPGSIPVLPFCTFRLLMADDAASVRKIGY